MPVGPDDTGPVVEVQADNVGLPTGEREHLATATADHDRRMRLAHRGGHAGVAGHRDVPTGHVDRFTREVHLDQGNDLGEPVDPGRRRIERDPYRAVLRLQPPRTEPQLESPVGQQVQGRRRLRQNGGHVVVDALHPRPDPKRVRHGRGGRQRRDRGQPLHGMVRLLLQ